MDNEIKKALNVLSAGGTILYPTDTIWGIGCDAFSDNAIKKVFKIKKRDLSKGLICLASSFEMVMKYVNINNIDLITKISKEAPTTFIFDNPRKISKLVSGNNSTIAFRVPQNNFCIKLIQEFGRPIVSTSANVSGDSFPNCYKEINPLLKDIVDYIVKYKDKDRIHSSSRIIKLCNDGSFKKLR